MTNWGSYLIHMLDNSMLNINILYGNQKPVFLFVIENEQLYGLGNSYKLRYTWGKSIMGKGVSPATGIILCIMFEGYLIYSKHYRMRHHQNKKLMRNKMYRDIECFHTQPKMSHDFQDIHLYIVNL